MLECNFNSGICKERNYIGSIIQRAVLITTDLRPRDFPYNVGGIGLEVASSARNAWGGSPSSLQNAWNGLNADPARIRSIGSREWARVSL